MNVCAISCSQWGTRLAHCRLGSLLPAVALCCVGIAQDTRPSDPTRTAIMGAIQWIARQAVPVEGAEGAALFPENAGDPRSPAAQVYGGTAGVLIFLENAAAILDDERARKLADSAARGLLAIGRRDARGVTWSRAGPRDCPSALYTGDAGIGHAFLVRFRLRQDPAALAIAVETGIAILARAERDGDALHWPDAQVDILFGAAGTLLFLLDLGEATADPRFTEGALAAARWLIRSASRSPSESRTPRLFWPCPMFGNEHLPNFSHGTAGVAYALARVAAATRDATCLRAARDGAEWLMDHAIREGATLYWPVSEGERRAFGGWCHGPPGTARLFLLLHALTDERRYLDAALASARWVMAFGAAATRGSTPRPLNPTLCCGVAGVVDFFCDLHRRTGAPEFADFAHRAGAHLLASATHDADGTRWPTPGSPSPRSGVDLMQGAAGEAMALLRLFTLAAAPDPIRHLPDRAVSAR